ncbi:MAG: hypothetical protein R3C14_27815 [Caldilineaceae bacterium]
MKSKILSVSLSLVLCLATYFSAYAFPYDFADPQYQVSGSVPGGSSSSSQWTEHIIYADAYRDAKIGKRAWKWYASTGNYSDANYAVGAWIAESLPTMIADPVNTSSSGSANVKFTTALCPYDFFAAGCVNVTQWATLDGFDVNSWTKATIYAIPDGALSPDGHPMYWGGANLHKKTFIHEMGHLLGLGDQYLDGGLCNPNSNSIMDGVLSSGLINGSYYDLYSCDPGFIQPNDNSRLWYYYYGGYYSYSSFGVDNNGAVTIKWQDSYWMDYAFCTSWRYSSSPTSGPYTFYSMDCSNRKAGSHKSVTPWRVLESSPIYPWNDSSLHGKWLTACSMADFDYLTSPSPSACTSQALYIP